MTATLRKPTRPRRDSYQLYSYDDKGGKSDVSNTFEPWLTEEHDKAAKAVGVTTAVGAFTGGIYGMAGGYGSGLYFHCGGCHLK